MPAHPVDHLDLTVVVYADEGVANRVRVRYDPVSDGVAMPGYRGEVDLRDLSQDDELIARITLLLRQISASFDRGSLVVDDQTIPVPSDVREAWFRQDAGTMLLLFGTVVGRAGQWDGTTAILPPGQRRLLESIYTTAHARAWAHFKDTLGLASANLKTQVFISYRKGHEQSVEAIARRLGREGLIPWFDAWEVLAGDSLPGKIEQGLANSVAFIAVLTADYAEGKWATEELESAIHRRVTEDSPIVPVLLEQCEKPELIRHLVHVDFSAQDPDQFESKCGELIDAINRLDRNPFRH